MGSTVVNLSRNLAPKRPIESGQRPSTSPVVNLNRDLNSIPGHNDPVRDITPAPPAYSTESQDDTED